MKVFIKSKSQIFSDFSAQFYQHLTTSINKKQQTKKLFRKDILWKKSIKVNKYPKYPKKVGTVKIHMRYKEFGSGTQRYPFRKKTGYQKNPYEIWRIREILAKYPKYPLFFNLYIYTIYLILSSSFIIPDSDSDSLCFIHLWYYLNKRKKGIYSLIKGSIRWVPWVPHKNNPYDI